MNNLQTLIENYLEYCKVQKQLDSKTLKAYQIDLKQFANQLLPYTIDQIDAKVLEDYIATLHKQYSPKTVKRKIASTKAFFHYLEYKDVIKQNPFNKVQIRFREPVILPKTIPLRTIEKFLSIIYLSLIHI